MRLKRPVALAVALGVALAVVLAPSIAAAKDPAQLFRARCAACHGEDGRGQTVLGKKEKAPDFTTADFQAGRTDEQIKAVIAAGKPGTKMAGFGDKLPAEEIDALARRVRAFGGKK